MKYSPEFLEANARLKTLDEETLNDALNEMTADELLAHGDYMIQQTIDEENRLSEEEEQAHINELLQLTREPSEDKIKLIKIHTHRTVKRIIILAAAILVLVSVFMASTIASKHDFSLFDGTVRFEDGRIHVQFPTTDRSATLSMTDFETNLEEHGFKDILLPGYFYEGEWAVENIKYSEEDNMHLMTSNIEGRQSYSISIILYEGTSPSRNITFYGAESGETIQTGDIPVYLFDHGYDRKELIYFVGQYEYKIRSFDSAEELKMIAKTIT